MQWKIIWKIAPTSLVEIELVESLLRPEDLEVSLRYVLKHATYRGSNIFQLFNTSQKPNHFVASRRRWLESQGRDDARQENGRNEWYDLGYQGAKAKAPPCTNSTLPTPLPQQGSSSAREEEDHWEVMEENSGRSENGSSVSSRSSDENNVGNGALFVIGLHGSGDAIAHFLQHWEVALSCHIALYMLCQELHEVERRRGWFGF